MVSAWVGVRQSILVSVFLANLLNFSMKWIARKSNDEDVTTRIKHIRIYVFIFGVISLFSCNLLQSGIFQAIISWIVLAGFVIMHYVNFKEFEDKKRAISRLVVISLLFLQCLGTIIQFSI